MPYHGARTDVETREGSYFLCDFNTYAQLPDLQLIQQYCVFTGNMYIINDFYTLSVINIKPVLRRTVTTNKENQILHHYKAYNKS